MSKRVNKRVNALKVILLETGVNKKPVTKYIQTIGVNFTDDQVRHKLNNIGFLNFTLISWKVEVLELMVFE